MWQWDVVQRAVSDRFFRRTYGRHTWVIIAYAGIYLFGAGYIIAFVANERRREILFWASAGILWGPIAILALISLPRLKEC